MSDLPGYIPHDEKRSAAVYCDLNKDFGYDGSDLVFDKAAISQALHNLFSTTVGEAGPIFNPEFGSLLPQLLHEPMDSVTEFKLRGATIQAVQRWEPRVQVDTANTAVFADVQNMAYNVVLSYFIRKTGERASSNLTISLMPEEFDYSPFSTLDFSVSYQLIGWPGVYEYAILDGTRLKYNGGASWGSLGEWSEFLSWGTEEISGFPFMRFTALVDRVITAPRKLVFDFHGSTSNQTVLVELATSYDGVDYSAFSPITPLPPAARFYKIKVTVIGLSPELTVGNLLFFI